MKYMQFFRYTVPFSFCDLLNFASDLVLSSMLSRSSTGVLEILGKYYAILLLTLFYVVYASMPS
jgi:hypothetical protein